jgi:hypothetical protein
MILTPPIRQDPAYHAFADSRALLGIPNFWNVATNLAFIFAAIAGWRALRSRNAFLEIWERQAFATLVVATALVGAGSAWYHLNPHDGSLVWDRLPMAIAFAAMVVTTLGERVGGNAGRSVLIPLAAFGVGSIAYWRWTGDLRPYALVQFGSIAIVCVLVLLRRSRYTAPGAVWGTVACYAVAKTAEMLDRPLARFVATGGHPWKHLAAGAGIALYAVSVGRRRPVAPRTAPVRHAKGARPWWNVCAQAFNCDLPFVPAPVEVRTRDRR